MERERNTTLALLVLLLVLWLGFAVHRSPRFPGSLTGGALAVAAALLMVLVPAGYSAVKRIERIKRFVTVRVPMRTLLSWHVYTATMGGILAILHTGHRFESNLGIALTAVMLAAILSGFVGRYFLRYFGMELREKQELVHRLTTFYNQKAGELSRNPTEASAAGTAPLRELSREAADLAEAIADVEYAIKTHELFKRRAQQWLHVHIVASLAFYLLLALHVWAVIHFGLRWFD